MNNFENQSTIFYLLQSEIKQKNEQNTYLYWGAKYLQFLIIVNSDLNFKHLKQTYFLFKYHGPFQSYLLDDPFAINLAFMDFSGIFIDLIYTIPMKSMICDSHNTLRVRSSFSTLHHWMYFDINFALKYPGTCYCITKSYNKSASSLTVDRRVHLICRQKPKNIYTYNKSFGNLLFCFRSNDEN